MFWQIIIFLTALQALVFCDDNQNGSSCVNAYSQLENLCYDYTGLAANYFSVKDVEQRDGFFGVREAVIYATYNACGKVTRSICYRRSGDDLEKDKAKGGTTPGGGNLSGAPSPASSGGGTPSPTPNGGGTPPTGATTPPP